MERHVQLMSQIEAQYMAKNCAYNNVSHVTFCRFGLPSYIIRLTDKMNRYENLRLHPDIDKGDEAIDDTLRDAINYVCMCIGDMHVDDSDIGSTENVKETLKVIRKLASLTKEDIKDYSAILVNSYVWRAAGGLLEDVPWALYREDASVNYYMYFAAYLIMLYLNRSE